MILWPIQSEFTDKLPYFFLGLGYLYEQEHVIRPNIKVETKWIFDYYQIIQCVHGKGRVILNHKTVVLQEEQFLFLMPNEPHEYYALSDKWIVNWIIFSGTAMDSFVKNILEIKHSDVFSLSASQIITDKIALLYNAFLSSNPAKDMYGSTLIYEILMDLYRFSFRKQTNSFIEKTNKLGPVFDYIGNNYQNPIALTDLAALVNITVQHLCTSFKTLTSHTVFEYIIMYRIQKSKEFLINRRSMLIKEIALNCGFNDVSYFCSIFKKYELMTPSDFRKLH